MPGLRASRPSLPATRCGVKPERSARRCHPPGDDEQNSDAEPEPREQADDQRGDGRIADGEERASHVKDDGEGSGHRYANRQGAACAGLPALAGPLNQVKTQVGRDQAETTGVKGRDRPQQERIRPPEPARRSGRDLAELSRDPLHEDHRRASVRRGEQPRGDRHGQDGERCDHRDRGSARRRCGPGEGLGHGADEPWIRGVIASFSSELRPMTVPPEATRGAGTSLHSASGP
ncbi:hypothetical protein BH20ACT23_BH20ACT23_28630 [soil metagenome]